MEIRTVFFKVRQFFQRQSRHLSGKITLALAIAALISCIITYLMMIQSSNADERVFRILPFVYLDLILLAALGVVIARRLYSLWRDHKQGLVGSRLHVRIVFLFSTVAITPAILVAVFSVLFFNVGVKAWFSEPVKEALREAQNVAEAYVRENQDAIRHEASMIVAELRPQVPMLIRNLEEFSEALTSLVDIPGRNIGEAIVFDINQQVVARSYLTFALEFEKIFLDAFQKAKQGELVILRSENNDRVRALVRLDPVTNTYLYLGKFVDPEVLKHLNKTEDAALEYKKLESQRSGLQLTFVAFFILIALILLLAAVWGGLSLAALIVHPVQKLIVAADAVRQGDLLVSVDVAEDYTELGRLADAFNRMISQLYTQRRELVHQNITLEQRQQFIESLLSSVSAGIMGVNKTLHIDLMNHRGIELLSLKKDPSNTSLKNISPEILSILEKVKEATPYFEQISIERSGRTRVLQVCVVPQVNLSHPLKEIQGYVITFDDITTLLSAQRKAAWSDVARKIAHEIKNPLTPIQLSAERLKRRYLKDIQNDPETFSGCIDTIIRQVGQIGKLVAEFSSFARMPEPDLKVENLNELCRQALFLQQQAHKALFQLNVPEKPLMFLCDAQQMSQALTNLLQNALDAMEKQPYKKIHLSLLSHLKGFSLCVEDNGPGFPSENRERLTEPYVTTRGKGTGLGLAIVAKIVEDHGGTLELGDSKLGGAAVFMHFHNAVHDLTSPSKER